MRRGGLGLGSAGLFETARQRSAHRGCALTGAGRRVTCRDGVRWLEARCESPPVASVENPVLRCRFSAGNPACPGAASTGAAGHSPWDNGQWRVAAANSAGRTGRRRAVAPRRERARRRRQLRKRARRDSSAARGTAPTMRSTSVPSSRTTSSGIERASKRAPSCGSSSTLTLTTLTRPG